MNLMRPSRIIEDEEEEEHTTKAPIDYGKELTFYFYNAMLKSLVKKWEVNVDDTSESIPSGDEVICSKPYDPYIETIVSEEAIGETLTPPTSQRKSKRISGYMRGSMMDKKRSGSRQSNLDVFSVTDIRKTRKTIHKSFGGKLKKSKSKMFGMKRFAKFQIEDLVKHDPTNDWIIKKEKETAEITFYNGNQYIGEMYGKLMHGTGQFKWRDGTTYTGDFKNGEMTGKGRIEFSDKSVYEGEFYKGHIHGYGNEYKSYKHAFYNGEYYLSSKHGQGRMVFGKNNYYEGPWKENKREGHGLRHYENGSKYQGDWVNGQRHGSGLTVFKNNDIYHGEWNYGKKHGYGEYIWGAFLNNFFSIPVQNKYCGIWDQGCMHGFGLLYFGEEGGARYAGTFYRNIKHGAGILVCNNGDVIKGDPLFINDKSVRHVKEVIEKDDSTLMSSLLINSGTSDLNDSFISCTQATCSNLAPSIYPILPQHTLKQSNFLNINHFEFPCYGFERSTIARINQYQLMFPHETNSDYVSLSINLSSCERIDLSEIINEVAAKYLFVIKNTHNKENTSSIKKRYFEEIKIWPCVVSEHFCEDYVFDRFNKYKECDNFFIVEEERARKAIRTNLPYLLELYDYYAFVACIHDRPSYKPWLMRICLWQLFVDCGMALKGISLNYIDEIMAAQSPTQVADIHNPFDSIYFWQFLMIIVTLAWKLHGNDYMNIATNGILGKAINKFMETNIFPNARKHKGVALFEYKDVIPITAAFEWYKSLGPNLTVYDFLKLSSTLRSSRPSTNFQNLGAQIPKIQYGENVAIISDKIIFRDKSSDLRNKKYNGPDVYAYSHDYFVKSLMYLVPLGSKKILTILKQICPMVAVQDEYINMNYELSFMEFYEVVLKCTQQKVNDDTAHPMKKRFVVKTRRTVCEITPRYLKFKSKISKRKKLSHFRKST